MKTKICSKCKIPKSLDKFYIRRKTQRHSVCKICFNESAKNRFAKLIKMPDKYLAKLKKNNAFYYLTKANANRRNIEFTLTKEDFENLPTICPIYNIPISYRNANRDNSISIDRIDNSKGYVKNNIVFISVKANRHKNEMSFEDIERLYKFYKTLKEQLD